MAFGEAMKAVKQGKRIQREGWNGDVPMVQGDGSMPIVNIESVSEDK